MKINNNLALTVCLALSISACSPKMTVEQYLAQAKTFSEKREHSSAIIALKNAVQMEPKNISARILLGQAYITVGNGEGAEKELNVALNLGGDNNIIIPSIVNSMMYLEDYDGVIDFVDNNNDDLTREALDDIQLYYALALSYLSKLNENDDIIIELKKSSNSLNKKIADLFILLAKNDEHGVKQVLEELSKKDVTPEVFFLLGKFYLGYQDYALATSMFTKYQGTRKNDLKVNLYKAQSLLGEKRLLESEELVDSVLSLFKEQPFANELKGIITYKKAEYEGAVFHSEKAIQNGLDNVTNRVIAGISNYAIENLERALQHLNNIKSSLPKSHPARKILILAELNLGKTDDAIASLMDANSELASYNELLLTIGNQFIYEGKTEKAKEIISDISSLKDSQGINLGQLGLMKVSLNDLSGIDDLKNVIKEDPESINNRLFLISSLLKLNKLDEALDEAKALILIKPDHIIGYNFAGSIAVKLEKISLAQSYFERAQTIQANNILSLMFYAFQDELNGDFDKSYDAVNDIVKENPLYAAGIKQLYKLAVKTNRVEKTLSAVESIVKSNKTVLELRLIYAGMLFEQNQYQKVINTLTMIEPDKHMDSSYWLFLGDAYVKLNDFNLADKTYSKWMDLKPSIGLAVYRRVSLLERLNKNKQALKIIQKALGANNNNQYLLLMEAYFLVQTKQYEQAENKLLSMSADTQVSDDYLGIKGLAELGQNKLSIGLKNLLIAYKKNPKPLYAQGIHLAYIKLGFDRKAEVFLDSHIKEHPSDYGSYIILANHVVANNKIKAIKLYESGLMGFPKQVIVLNNLAWLYLEQNDISKAEFYIKKALRIVPLNIVFLDTYAQVLFAQGKHDDVINIYKAIGQENKLTDEHKIYYMKSLIAQNNYQAARDIASSINVSDNEEISLELTKLLEVIKE